MSGRTTADPPRRAAPRSVPDSGRISALGRDAGLDAVGVASAEPFASTRLELERRRDEGLHGDMAFTYRNPARSTEPSRIVPEAAALVVGAMAYRRPEPERPAGTNGRVARYSWIDHYRPLKEALEVVAVSLRELGWTARVVADDNALVDRAAAHRAGLGWYGKNANLLLPGQGSWFVLGAVVTDAPLEPAGTPVDDGCGSCTRCLDACPTGAIVAPGVVDARRCLAWLVQAPGSFPAEHREALGDRIYGCDDCQEVCPPNRLAERRGVADAAPVDGDELEAWVDLIAILTASDDELLDRHGRWYIPRREPRYLRRNALVALGNTADPADARVTDVVARALGDEEPLVRAHAVWAARRLGFDDLLDAVRDDPDPDVQAELATEVARGPRR